MDGYQYENRCAHFLEENWLSFKSTRDPKFLSYKRQMKENCLFYDKLIKEHLEGADKFAVQCVSGGVSEKSALELVSMISYIYNEGGFSVAINDQVVAESKWTAKHTRIYEKWLAFGEELPSKIQARDKAEEAQELRYAKENLSTARKSIMRLRKELRALEEKSDNESGDLEAKETELVELQSAYDTAKKRVSAAESEQQHELEPIKKRYTEVEKELSVLKERRGSLQQELAGISVLAFGRKKGLRNAISELSTQTESLILQQSNLNGQLASITQKYEQIISQLKAERQKLDRKQKQAVREIEKLRKRIAAHTSKKEIRTKEQELAALQDSLPGLETQVKNAHRLFLEKRLQT